MAVGLGLRVALFSGYGLGDDPNYFSAYHGNSEAGTWSEHVPYDFRFAFWTGVVGFLKLVGITEWGWVGFVTLCSVLNMPLAYALARQEWGRGWGLLVMALLAVFPLDVMTSTLFAVDIPLATSSCRPRRSSAARRSGPVVCRSVALTAHAPVPKYTPHMPALVYALVAGNILALWLRRGPFVGGWDLFGATFGVLVLHEGAFTHGVRRIWEAVLNQRGRPVFTGGESFLYGLLPGMLNDAAPWLLWSHLVCLALFVGLSFWLLRRLRAPAWLYWAGVLASPALVSHTIVGLPDLPSNALAWGLAIGWVLGAEQTGRRVFPGLLLDVVVFAAITFVAFNGYESGKTFFFVPIVAALTVPRIPIVRRLGWLACGIAIARLVDAERPGTTDAALAAVPHDAALLLHGVVATLRAYVVDWYIDFPALAIAAVIGLLVLRRNRLFWAGVFGVVLGLVTLNAFQYDGGFLVPHRFLLVGFISALIVASALAEPAAPRAALAAMGLLLASGAVYTTWTTVRFVTGPQSDAPHQNEKVYALPYNRAKLDAHIWRDRIRDATTAVDAIRRGSEPHLFFYGFSILGEDSVNPQMFVSRVLLSLGWDRFARRTVFFDHGSYMYFQFPIHPLADVPATLARLESRSPFFVHVREPEYSGPAIVARWFNRAHVEPVDLGLTGLRSYRVEAWAPPGPIPIGAPAPARVVAASETPGFCLTTWRQDEGAYSHYSPLYHPGASLPDHFRGILSEAQHPPPGSKRYLAVTHGVTAAPDAAASEPTVVYLRGRLQNPGDTPRVAALQVDADDEVAVAVNGQIVLETLGWKPLARYQEQVALPPGPSELEIFYHKFWHPGGVHVSVTDAEGAPLPATCAGS